MKRVCNLEGRPIIEELRGRLHLWTAALLECDGLLTDAAGAIGARNGAEVGSRAFNDLHATQERFTALATVFFCQMFNLGHASLGVAAGNREAVVKDERERVIAACFPSATERAAFDALFNKILTARDKMIAHADGGHFEIEHYDYSVISATHYECLKDIDIQAWRNAIRSLQREIGRRAKELGVGMTATTRRGSFANRGTD